MPNVSDIVNNPKKELTVHCWRSFWRNQWRYHIKHRNGNVMANGGESYANLKDMLKSIGTIMGKNEWPVYIKDDSTPIDMSIYLTDRS